MPEVAHRLKLVYRIRTTKTEAEVLEYVTTRLMQNRLDQFVRQQLRPPTWRQLDTELIPKVIPVVVPDWPFDFEIYPKIVVHATTDLTILEQAQAIDDLTEALKAIIDDQIINVEGDAIQWRSIRYRRRPKDEGPHV